MTLKKKFREFFTLTRKAEGFTLVELIVVIAIMAILAGVAVPAYTGYIKKAETAADEQLLSSLNTAFAAACMMHGEDNRGRSDASASLSGEEGAMTAIVTTGNEKINAAFIDLYEGGTFKVFESLQYVESQGMFVNAGDPIAILKALLDGSSYSGKLDIVTGTVDELTSALSAYLGENFDTLAGSGFSEYLAELGIDSTDSDKQAEAAILYLAQNAASMDETKIAGATTAMNDLLTAIVVGEGDQTVLVNKLTEQTGSSLASYAAIYAVAEGIALQQGEGSAAWNALHGSDVKLTDAQSVLTAMGNVVGSLSDEDAVAYMTNSTSADMNAYFNALQSVNKEQAALEEEVKNGNSVIESDAIQNLITQVTGS